MHSKKFETIRAAYKRGSYTAQMVRNLAAKGWVTDDEAEQIIGGGDDETLEKSAE